MAMNKDDSIAVLNDLIATSEDGVNDFRSCANAVKNSEAKAFFNDRVRLIQRGLTELQNEVRRLGGHPERHETASGSTRRTSMDLESTLAGTKDDGAVLSECARAEEAAVKKYQDALEQDLSPEVRDIVERQLGGVLENRDRVRSLRDSAATARSSAPREVDRGAPPPP
jgi:uncharacterized protein (TIGR02284 family)